MENKEQNGILYVISGPSGVGKGSVIKEILSQDKDLVLSISVTTRKPRDGEVNGKDYCFVSKKDFKNKIRNNEFLEWAEVHGQLYGTLKEFVEKHLNNKKKIILEIDINGANQVIKTNYPKKTIFITPPSEEELIRRLRERNTDTEGSIDKRLTQAKNEMREKEKYDYIIENKEIKNCAKKILDIIKIN